MAERMIIPDDPEQKKFFDQIQAVAPNDEKLSKAIDFTILEDDCLAEWLEAVLRGQLGIARRLLRAGLMVEHYRSLLDDVIDENDEASFAQRTVLNNLRVRFRLVREEFRKRNQGSDAPVERAPRERL